MKKLFLIFAVMFSLSANAQNVVQRGNAARPVARTAPVVAAATRATETVAAPVLDIEYFTTAEPVAHSVAIADKSAAFGTLFDNSAADDAARAARLRNLRDTSMAADAIVKPATVTAMTDNKCDSDLRKCMTDLCGEKFTKCATDTDTNWGNKLTQCRVKTNCSASEWAPIAVEIKADRDADAKLSHFNAVRLGAIDYNNCIIAQCGTNYAKCIPAAGERAAREMCAVTLKKYIALDTALESRSVALIAALRTDIRTASYAATARLSELRDLMRARCRAIGGSLDDDSLDCVFPIEFYAGDTLLFERNLIAGMTYECIPEWFGIDATTYMDNAARHNVAQQSALGGFMGAGVGVAAGAVSSGAISRGIDAQKERDALAEQERLQGGLTNGAGGGDFADDDPGEPDSDEPADYANDNAGDEPADEQSDGAEQSDNSDTGNDDESGGAGTDSAAGGDSGGSDSGGGGESSGGSGDSGGSDGGGSGGEGGG